MNGIFISTKSLNSAEPDLRLRVMSLAGFDPAAGTSVKSNEELVSTGSAFAMSQEFAREFLSKCGPKTRKTLSAICEMDGRFQHSDLETRVGMGPLRGVWTGITNRLRNVSGDPHAKLIDWDMDEELDAWVGTITQVSMRSLRAALTK